jgi:hypothetical protein
LLSAPPDSRRALGIEHGGGFKPAEQRVEIAQGVGTDAAVQIICVDEIQPQPLTEENELAS